MQLGIVLGPRFPLGKLLVDATSRFQGGPWSKPKFPCRPEARGQGWVQSCGVSQWLVGIKV